MDNIYIVRGTEQAGPFTEAEIRGQLASGVLTGDSMVWWEGLTEWTPISRTPLANAPASPIAPVLVAAPAPIAPAPAGVTAPIAAVPGSSRASVLAIVSLVTGILGLPFIICWIVGVPLQIAAIVTGHLALAQIGKDPAQSGKGMALSGLICGYLGLALLIVFTIIILTLGHQVKDIFTTIQSQLNAVQMTNSAPASPNP